MIRYIFSISTGRSGSNYLANTLGEVENVHAFHEPHPIMNGEPMIEFLKGNHSILSSMMNEKLINIKAEINKDSIYVETNHTFIKGFGWFVPSFIPHEEIGIIFLKREKCEIVNSYKRINCTPLTIYGLDWLMTPLMINPINPVSLFDKIIYRILFSPSHLSLLRIFRSKYNIFNSFLKEPEYVKKKELKFLEWYVDETYAQGERFKIEYPKIKIYETTVSNLNNEQEYKNLFSFFGIDFNPKKSFYERIGRKTNLRHFKTK